MRAPFFIVPLDRALADGTSDTARCLWKVRNGNEIRGGNYPALKVIFGSISNYDFERGQSGFLSVF